MPSKSSSDDIKNWSKISEKLPLYEALCENIVGALKAILKDSSLKYSMLEFRVKKEDSIKDKIARKGYSDPEYQIEDIAGVRVILYYSNDVGILSDLIDKEFNVIHNEDKSNALAVNEVGYRSHHKIVQIPKTWCKVPNYKGMENLKCEIQIRTVLMHAWAAIEHELQYKNESDIPTQLKRKIYLLSGKLEEADDQFLDVRNQISEYESEVKNRMAANEELVEINVDSLSVMIESIYPDRESPDDYSKIVAELSPFYESINALKDDLTDPILVEIIEELEESLPISGSGRFTSAGLIRVAQFVRNPDFLNKNLSSDHMKTIYEKFHKKYIEALAQQKA
ncbi:GTP pyrophosphokinase family protein [Hyphobacterium sp.]|uniref:GTP pyrophosphokinase n=1 Tax=Hyphobacterium sp. TaxID=2004662 RepID=UPI0037494694